MNRLETPQVVTDVYRDLRDRRLLIVVAALLVAIVAVPFLLAKKPAAAPAVPPPSGVGNAAQMTMPAVTLADQPGATNYRKRLAAFETKNPFKAQFVVQTSSGTGTGAGTGSSSSPFAAGAPASPSSAPTITPPTSSPSSPASGAPSSTVPPTSPTSPGGSGGQAQPGGGNGGNGGSGSNKPTIRTVTRLFTRRVDVQIAQAGDNPTTLKSIEPMSILPRANTPVVAFLGTDENGKNAAFVLSSRSVATGGTGSCVPAPDDCIYVTMQPGQSLTVDYTPPGSTDPVSYELTLLKIRDVHVKQSKSKAFPPAQGAAYASSGAGGG